MAIHENIPSMLKESLTEMLLVAKYCIEFRKDAKNWPAPGCYGYPAGLLLLSIADSIGSYVVGGNVENHFKVLNESDYYGLDMDATELGVIYNNYRNLLSHNTVMATNCVLNIGSKNDPVLQKQNGLYCLNLVPLYNASVKAVNAFLDNPDILKNNPMLNIIHKKK